MIDIRDLIGGPYVDCPQCAKPSFGVLSVHAMSYTRKCRECLYREEFHLWPLEREVLYIDQFAISNMMKALNTTINSHDKALVNPLWLRLFEALERACKLQLVICPHSDAHRHESLVSPFFRPLERMYEQLSHGVSFDRLEVINQRQLSIAVHAWIEGREPVYDNDPKTVTNGGLHDWKEPLIISVNMTYPKELVDGIRTFRDNVHKELIEIYESYRKSGRTDFKVCLEHERTARGGR